MFFYNLICQCILPATLTKSFPTNTTVYYTLKRRRNGRFHVVLAWNIRAVFVVLSIIVPKNLFYLMASEAQRNKR